MANHCLLVFMRPFLYVSALCMLLASCSAAAPPEALMGVQNRSAPKLHTQEIGAWIPGADKSLAVVVMDARLQGGGRERRSYLQGKDGTTRYLGALSRQLPDAPLESLFFEVNGARFALLWVDETVAGDVETVTLGHPQQAVSDDSIITLGAGANRLAIVPMAAGEAGLSNQLSDIMINTGDAGFAWQRTYDPPVEIQPLVQRAALP